MTLARTSTLEERVTVASSGVARVMTGGVWSTLTVTLVLASMPSASVTLTVTIWPAPSSATLTG